MFCLPQQVADVFKEKLKTGEINPEKLMDMTSDERRAFFSEFMSEPNAKSVNTLFESKLLLKNQQQGIVNWAKQLIGLKPEIKRDIISKVERMTDVLQPKEMDGFLADLAEQKLGVGVTLEEAGKIVELSQKVAEAKDVMLKGGDRMAYGRAVVDFHEYMNELKANANALTVEDFKQKPVESTIEAVKQVPGMAKSIKASFDDSALFRQGWKTLFTHPGDWYKNAKQSFVDLVKTFGGKEVMKEVNADIASRPNSVNGLYKKAKLAVGTVEEAYPTALPEKVPVLGRAYKASEVAYTAFLHRMRADVFDKYVEIARKSDVDLTDKQQVESIGKLVNSLTGRANLGRAEPVANVVNNVFFSPRKLVSDFDVLTMHARDTKFSSFARKQAAINLVKVISGTAAILTIARAINPKAVEWDPRSSDFGKIKIGDTRFDVTGGMGSLATLAARWATNSSKSNGVVGKLNQPGGRTTGQVIADFFTNKLSPVSSVLYDTLIRHQTFQGTKPTIANEAANLFVPLPITNAVEMAQDPKSAPMVLGLIADALGINTNTYAASSTNWNTSTSVEVNAFKQKVGQQKFDQANKLYNTRVNEWLDQVKDTPKYKNLSDEQKQTAITTKKNEIRTEVFKKYGFTYHKKASKPLPKF